MICHLLYHDRVLTTSQIADVGFDSPRREKRTPALLSTTSMLWTGSNHGASLAAPRSTTASEKPSIRHRCREGG